MLSPRTIGVCGRTVLHLGEAINQLEGQIFVTVEEQQMMEAAKAVLDRAFDEVMIMFTHLNNDVLKEREIKKNLTPVGAQGAQVWQPQEPIKPDSTFVGPFGTFKTVGGTNNQALKAEDLTDEPTVVTAVPPF